MKIIRDIIRVYRTSLRAVTRAGKLAVRFLKAGYKITFRFFKTAVRTAVRAYKTTIRFAKKVFIIIKRPVLGFARAVVRFEKKVPNWPVYIGIFLVSLSVLALETILNRMFALTFWYHFAFIILSVALFGIGFGGMLVYFINRFVKKMIPYALAVSSVLLAFSIPWALAQINTIPLEMNQVAVNPAQQALFAQFFLTLVVPFILAGYIFSTVFTNFSREINKVYFFDLLGGGIGCFFALLVFPHNGPLTTAAVVSVVVLLAAALFTVKKNWVLSAVTAVLALTDIFAVMPAVKNTEIRISQEKRNVEVIGKREFADWDNFGFVAVHSKKENSKVVTADYSCFTYLFQVPGLRSIKYFSRFIPSQAYPYVVKSNPDDVGIIGVGAGKDVLIALGNGAKNVWGAEFNATIHRVFSEIYGPFLSDVAKLSNVHVRYEEGRFFIRSSKRMYDVLVFDNSISAVAVSSGSFTLAESYLFTVEGMIDYISHLRDGGILFLSNPYIEAPRFVTLIREAYRRMNREKEFKNSIIVIDEPGEYRKCKVLVKKGGFTLKEGVAIANYARSIGNKPLYTAFAPYQTDESRLVLSKDIEKEYFLSETDLRPSTDDWPYFSQHVKPSSKEYTQEIYAAKRFYPQPFLLLREITKQVGIYSLLFLLLPLVILNLGGLRKLPNKIGSMAYFSCLGLGFMLMEVVMIQKYTLILGHPMYSFSVVLSTLLVSSGIGSFITDRIKSPFRAVFYGLCGIVGTTVLTFVLVLLFGAQMIGLPVGLRILSVAVLVAMTGLFMGFMMPAGIRAISKHQNAIPWMWSLNGIFSVVASFVAVILSIVLGYTAVFIAGLAVYVIGSILFMGRYSLKE